MEDAMALNCAMLDKGKGWVLDLVWVVGVVCHWIFAYACGRILVDATVSFELFFRDLGIVLWLGVFGVDSFCILEPVGEGVELPAFLVFELGRKLRIVARAFFEHRRLQFSLVEPRRHIARAQVFLRGVADVRCAIASVLAR